MNIGKLDKKVDIRKQVLTPSSYGEPIITWSTLIKQRWACVRPYRGQELFQSMQIQSEINTEITLRYTTLIHPTMVAVCDGVTYDIAVVLPDADYKKTETILLCSARVT